MLSQSIERGAFLLLGGTEAGTLLGKMGMLPQMSSGLGPDLDTEDIFRGCPQVAS